MKKDEHTKLLNDLKSCATDADRMNLIVKLEQDYTTVLSERDTLATKAQLAETECTKYAKLNNELWLANSAQDKGGQTTTPITDDSINNPPEKRTYEDLESKFD